MQLQLLSSSCYEFVTGASHHTNNNTYPYITGMRHYLNLT